MSDTALKADAASRIDDGSFREIADHLPSLCWLADADGYIFWYNRRWYDYTGASPADMEGWGWQSVHDPVQLPGVLERWTCSIATGKRFEMVFPLRGADGIFREFLTRIEPICDARGKVLRWLGTNTDISEQKSVERALVEANVRHDLLAAEQMTILSQLAQALEAKEVLLHEVNHRVKNSLQLVTSLLALQSAQIADPAVKQSMLDARARVGVVASIHQRLYSTSEHDRVDFTAYLEEMARETLAAIGGQPNIDMNFIADSGPVVIVLDKAVPLALVVSELVTNAVKYAFTQETKGCIDIMLNSTPTALKITVRDNGVGLSQDFNIARSSGLGMRIVRSLMKQLRGEVTATRLDRGTEFSLDVPLAAAQQR